MATSINFPDNPTIDETYTYSGTTYIWNGVTWGIVPSGLSPNTVGIVQLKPELKVGTDLGDVGSVVNIDCSLGIHFKMNMTSAMTSLTFSNYSTQQYKTITLEITGNFTIAQPATVEGDWTAYDGTLTNQIQIYLFNVTAPVFSSALINW
jgi:hypothetical protein